MIYFYYFVQVVLAPATACKKNQGYSINRGQVVRARVTGSVRIAKLIGKQRVFYSCICPVFAYTITYYIHVAVN